MSDNHGIVLAGGISSRMGFPKALMPFGNSFFLLEVYSRLSAAGIDPVHMVINTGLRSSLEEQMEHFPKGSLVLNGEPSKGQIHSLRLGLEAAEAAGAARAVVALVDQPFVRSETIRALVAAAAEHDGGLVLPSVDGRRGHPFVVSRSLFAQFVEAQPSQTAKDIIQTLEDKVRLVEVHDLGTVQDVDSPGDLARLTSSSESSAEDLDLD